MRKVLWLVVTLTTLAATVLSQTEPIETDRPDQTEATGITPVGSLQFEHGIALEREGGISLIAHPSSLLKYGISDRFEVRCVVEPVTISGKGSPTTRGLLPIEFGFKSKLWDADDGSSALSFIAHLQMPHLASTAFRGTHVAPLARFAADKALSDNWRVGANVGMEWDAGGGSGAAIYTLAAGSSLSESMGWYGEVYGFFPMEQLPADHRVNGGITYLLNEDLQLDAALGVGLSSTPAPWFVGVGVSYRFAVIR